MKCVSIVPLALLCVAAMLPPIPPVRKVYRHAEGTTQGSGALKLISRPRKIVTERPGTLSWTWSPNPDNPASNVVFLVRMGQLTTPVSQWPVIGVSTSNSFPIAIDLTLPSAFFTVSASNTESHLVSDRPR